MARRYKRDAIGRFASKGSGGIGSSRRSTSTGADARRGARTVRGEQTGRTGRARYQAGSARAALRGRAASIADGGSKSGAKLLGNVAVTQRGKSNQSRAKVKTMERERRSLLRRGSMRGGG